MVGYLGSVHAVIYATLGTKCTFPMYRPTVHYSLAYLIPSCPPVYTLSTYHHILSIPLIHHVSLAFTHYSILPYHTLPYPILNYFTLSLLKLDRNDSWQNRLEPLHDKTNKMACAPSEDSDQPGHPPSLIRVFAVRSVGGKNSSFLHADSEDSDQVWS